MRQPVLATILLPLAVLAALAWTPGAGAAGNLLSVPPGNRNATQPEIPAGALSRTRATGGDFHGKYEKIRDTIAGNRALQQKMKAAAARYGIAPIHIVGALIGEHTYNVDALDHLQTYVVKAAAYLGSKLTFAHDGEKVTTFVTRPEFAPCEGAADSYDLWWCREEVWETRFRGQTVGAKTWPNDRFGRVFFQPLYAGQTFGLGQLNPLTALAVNDLVVRVSRLPPLSADQAPEVYRTIMDPDSSLEYIAAVIRTSIDAYAQIAGMDISANPGITATLYNLGDVRDRARALKARNEGKADPDWPQENYYGWLVNDKLAELDLLVR
ncbi:MAG: hypothetical protein BroJett024_38770 [Alphaproteobacteria bacterium]|nr:MAG: hypothetical protein BroJett024_38770 [Alphaproteobacteria bacterium]